MSSQDEQIRALKAIFEKAKHSPRRESGKLFDLDLQSELLHALCTVGDEKFFELKEEIYPYLKDRCAEFREEAVRTLGGCNGLQLDEFRDEAYKIWLNDPNENVKSTAINAWGGYYVKTKDPFVLKILYNIFKSENHSIDSRTYALYWFMQAADEISYPGERLDVLNFEEIEDQRELTKSIDWVKVQRIMKQYVPGWKKQT